MEGDGTTALVDFICVTGAHIEIGEGVPDGHGTLTTERGRWAYCTAGLQNAPHEWKSIRGGGVSLEAIHHADLEPLVAN